MSKDDFKVGDKVRYELGLHLEPRWNGMSDDGMSGVWIETTVVKAGNLFATIIQKDGMEWLFPHLSSFADSRPGYLEKIVEVELVVDDIIEFEESASCPGYPRQRWCSGDGGATGIWINAKVKTISADNIVVICCLNGASWIFDYRDQNLPGWPRKVSSDAPILPTSNLIKCCCGVDSVGCGNHSSYCPKHSL